MFPIIRHTGVVEASGSGAQVNLSSATISGGTLSVGGGSFAETVAGSGTSTLSNLAVTGSGTLEANTLSTLYINNSSISYDGQADVERPRQRTSLSMATSAPWRARSPAATSNLAKPPPQT